MNCLPGTDNVGTRVGRAQEIVLSIMRHAEQLVDLEAEVRALRKIVAQEQRTLKKLTDPTGL